MEVKWQLIGRELEKYQCRFMCIKNKSKKHGIYSDRILQSNISEEKEKHQKQSDHFTTKKIFKQVPFKNDTIVDLIVPFHA